MDPPLSYVESPSEAPGINVRERWYGLSPMQHNEHSQHTKENHYLRLVGMIALSLISMYVLMYSMVHSFADVYNSLNQFYMTGLMTAPMVVIEMLLMSGMYKNKRLNAIIIAVSCALETAFFWLIRQQTAISDRQFLRSMIPHHSGAILMCEDASIQDARIKEPCKTIIAGQRSEIDQMRALLQENASAR
jgi:dipeptide/tripeptide permease